MAGLSRVLDIFVNNLSNATVVELSRNVGVHLLALAQAYTESDRDRGSEK